MILLNLEEFFGMFKPSPRFTGSANELGVIYECFLTYQEDRSNILNTKDFLGSPNKLIPAILEAEELKEKIRLLQEALDL